MSCFSMRENKQHQTPHQWLPLPWEGDEDEEDQEPPITEEEQQELLDIMAEENARLAAEQKKIDKE